MKKNARKALCVMGSIVLAGALFAGGAWYGCWSAENIPGVTVIGGGEEYTNNASGYSFIRPSTLSVIEEGANMVTFKENADEPWVMSIVAEKTTAASTEDWVRSQKKGGPSTPGIVPEIMVGEKMIISEYVVTDSDETTTIFAKMASAVMVHEGTLYRIHFRNQFATNDPLSLDEDLLNAIVTFQAR